MNFLKLEIQKVPDVERSIGIRVNHPAVGFNCGMARRRIQWV